MALHQPRHFVAAAAAAATAADAADPCLDQIEGLTSNLSDKSGSHAVTGAQMIRRTSWVCLLSLLLSARLVGGTHADTLDGETEALDARPLVGINYFSGW